MTSSTRLSPSPLPWSSECTVKGLEHGALMLGGEAVAFVTDLKRAVTVDMGADHPGAAAMPSRISAKASCPLRSEGAR